MTFESSSSSTMPPTFESDSLSSPNSQDHGNMSLLAAPILKRSILKKARSDKKDGNEAEGESQRLSIFQSSDEDGSSSSANIASKSVTFAIPLEQIRMIPNREDEPWRDGYFQKYKSKRQSLRRFLFNSKEEHNEAVKKFCQWRVETGDKSFFQSHLSRRSAEDASTFLEVPRKKFKFSSPLLNGPATCSDQGEPFDQASINDSDDIKMGSILIRQREDDDVTSSGMPAKRVRFASYVQPEKLTFAKIAKRGDSDEESSSEDSDQESSDEDNDETINSILVPKKSELHKTAEEDQTTSSEEEDASEESSGEDSDEDNDSITIPKKSEKDKAGEEDLFLPDSSNEVEEEEKSDEEEDDEAEDSEEDSEDEKESKDGSLESGDSTSDSEEDKNENSSDTEHLEQKSAEQETSSEGSEESEGDDEPGKPESLPENAESSEEIQETPEEPIPMEVCDNEEEVVVAESNDEMDKMEVLENEEKEEQKDEQFTLDMAPINPIVTNVEIISTAPPINDMKSTPTAGKSPYDLEGDDIPSTSTGRTHATDSPFDMDDFMFPMAQAAPNELNVSDSSQSSYLNFSSSDFGFNDDFFFNDDNDDNGQYVTINYDL